MVGNRDKCIIKTQKTNITKILLPSHTKINNFFIGIFISFSSVSFPFWQLFSKTALYQDRLTEVYRYEWTNFRFSVRMRGYSSCVYVIKNVTIFCILLTRYYSD